MPGAPLRTGTRAYNQHIEEEIAHYRELYEGPKGDRARLMETSTQAWDEVHNRAAERIEALTGHTMEGHILARLKSTPNARLLSLGCGPGGVELTLAREAPDAHFLGLDVNAELLTNVVNSASDATLNETWTMRYGPTVYFQGSRVMALRAMGISHIVHHRGQLSVYLRLLDTPVPGLYGPSADERGG